VTGRRLARWYRPADGPALAALFAEAFPGEDWSEVDFERFVTCRRRTNVLKVLEEGGRVVAALGYTVTPLGSVRLRRLAVRADRRRHGLASWLLAVTVGRRTPLARRGCSARVREDNWVAQRTLVSAGFTFDPAAPRDRDAAGRDYYVFLKAPVPWGRP
jgi:ribosomal protein S18 acetylase RimI-like enzyme